MLREILTYPDDRLRQISQPVLEYGEIPSLVKDMRQVMIASKGVGLSAVQVNVPLRVAVIDVTSLDKDIKPRVLINPEIVDYGKFDLRVQEGCLSVDYEVKLIPRSSLIRLKHFDMQGRLYDFWVRDLLAIVVQHEVDHMNGKLIVDYEEKIA